MRWLLASRTQQSVRSQFSERCSNQPFQAQRPEAEQTSPLTEHRVMAPSTRGVPPAPDDKYSPDERLLESALAPDPENYSIGEWHFPSFVFFSWFSFKN